MGIWILLDKMKGAGIRLSHKVTFINFLISEKIGLNVIL